MRTIRSTNSTKSSAWENKFFTDTTIRASFATHPFISRINGISRARKMATVVSFLSFARSEGDDNHAVARQFREKMGITSTRASIIHLPRHPPVTLSPRIDAAVGVHRAFRLSTLRYRQIDIGLLARSKRNEDTYER